MDKKSFVCYNDWIQYTNELPDEYAGRLFKAILAYNNGVELPEMDLVLKVVRAKMKPLIDENNKKYDEHCEKQRARAKKRWDKTTEQSGNNGNTMETDGMPDDATASHGVPFTDTGTDTDFPFSNEKGFPNGKQGSEFGKGKGKEKPLSKPKNQRHPGVDNVIKWMKFYCEKHNLFYSKGRKERIFAYNMCTAKEFQQAVARENRTLEGFIENIIFISSNLWIKEAYSPQLLYDNYPAILNGWRKLDLKKKQELNEKAKKLGQLTPEEKEAKKQENLVKMQELQKQREIEEKQKKETQEAKTAKVEDLLAGMDPPDIDELRREFESEANSTVLKALENGYENKFVKSARYAFLFAKFF